MISNKGIFIGLFFACSLLCVSLESSSRDLDSLYIQAMQLQYSHPDSAKNILVKCLPWYEERSDTLHIFNIRLKLIQLYSGVGHYRKAYDQAWALLPYNEHDGFFEQKIRLNKSIVSLYIIFEQYDKANDHLDEAFTLSRKLNEEKQSRLKLQLYSLKAWLTTKASSDFDAAKNLLMKSLKEGTKSGQEITNLYTRMQLAELYMENDSLQISEGMLKKIEAEIEGKTNLAHSLLYDHMGMLFMKKGDFDSAVFYLKKTISAIDKYKNHLDNKVEVLDSLSSCYHYMNQNDSAFHYAQESKLVSERLFGSRNSMNRELFEIRNEYDEQLKEQKLRLLEKEKAVLQLRTTIYVSILVIVIAGFIIQSRVRTRKMNLLRKNQALERKQKEHEIESKNKELVSSALQIIERESVLEEVKKTLNSMNFNSNNQKPITNLIASISAAKKKKWNEFELYFTQVNEDFYQVLKNKFPKLSPTDYKMCALIKLGLSSKEMADIMGIGADSINTSRSRIRKKMELRREINLTEYLREV